MRLRRGGRADDRSRLHRGPKGARDARKAAPGRFSKVKRNSAGSFNSLPISAKCRGIGMPIWATYAEQAMLAGAGETPIGNRLGAKLGQCLADLSKAQRQGLLNRLVEEGRRPAHPKLPGGKACKYCVHPPDPRDYLRAAIARLRKQIDQTGSRLAPLGVSTEQLFAAAIELLGGSPAAGSDVGRIANPSGCQVDFRDGLPIRPTAKPDTWFFAVPGRPEHGLCLPGRGLCGGVRYRVRKIGLPGRFAQLRQPVRSCGGPGRRGLAKRLTAALRGCESTAASIWPCREPRRPAGRGCEAGILEAGSLLLYVFEETAMSLDLAPWTQDSDAHGMEPLFAEIIRDNPFPIHAP